MRVDDLAASVDVTSVERVFVASGPAAISEQVLDQVLEVIGG